MSDLSPAPAPRSRGIYLLPNLLTTGGLFSGFYAILAAADGRFEIACIAVFVAGLFDSLDGRIARYTGTTSEFGVQYDSLADLVSFGMAPALVMYHWALVHLKGDASVLGKVGWAAAFLYVACAALRLARFNTQVGSADKRWFIGLASPAAAGLLMAFVWTFDDLGFSGNELRHVALVLTVCAALAMVSRARYYSFKAAPRSDRVPFLFMLMAVLVIVALFIDPPKVLLTVGLVYLVSGPLGWLWQRRRRSGAGAE
ncbi:MAG: CDP-diacylglycerol--serine O-phosphatidyltransferase [Gammaproteobacteria bacterium HGW-Gammaproteobacteria-4]|jgi:CDP-diacylglycerol--serine O-phosphatidyltransferase|nr:MAG: CDP-diacylglycerol--serine O-phosphatidyltransferase [Gammaproteobacteria bacterium HGW-Gammaproteobacteria-4]